MFITTANTLNIPPPKADIARCVRRRPGPPRSEDRLLKCWRELQICITQLTREGSPPPGLPRSQAKLSRNSNQIACERIRRFESYMPSQAVVSNSRGCRLGNG